ncbi:MAG: NAD(P)-dependent oxidoreductase [Actinobacteria bacterium]|nr:MAG: NAD(P)-dependent oxidoreductase [Actinomycetota bacterium]
MTIVVTGAAGWFGSAFLDVLRHQDVEDVRVLVHSPADVPTTLAALPDARIHVGDVADPAVVSDLFAGVDSCEVVHAAAVIHPARVSDFERVNAVGAGVIVSEALRHGLRRFVHLSSNSAVGTNPTPEETFRDNEPYDPYLGYGLSKMRGEVVVRRALEEATVPGVILRPPWFYGRFQPARQARFLKTVREGRFPLIGDGRNRRSMVDVDRLADCAWLALRSDTEAVRTYWVADARPYSMNEILDAVREAAIAEGLPVREAALHLPAVAGKVAYRVDALLQRFGRYQQEIHVAGELDKNIACTVDGAIRDLGFEPARDLVDGMRVSYRWGLENGQDV